MKIAITNGHLIDPRNKIDRPCDLFIQDNTIIATEHAPDGFSADKIIDADKLIVSPGFVDLCARLREPGLEHKGTILSETRAAVAGGVTSLCIPPDTDPVLDNPAVIELIHQRNEEAGFCRVYTLAAITKGLEGEFLSEMALLKEAGCIGVSNVMHSIPNPQVMRRALEYAASVDMTVFLHPQDKSLANNGCVHEGIVSTRLGLNGVPETAETQAVANFLMLIEQTGVRVHFCHLSTARAVQMIGRAKYDGLAITADVAAHQLHLTEMDIGYFDSQCHVQPPLRTQRDCDALRAALASAQIEAICSDHQPHDVDAKLAPFPSTEAGMSSIETLFPLSLRLVNDGLLTMSELIDRLSTTPAEIIGINAGHLGVGAMADVTIFDPELHWVLKTEDLVSRGKNTPFKNWEFQGKIMKTICAGKLVYDAEASS